MVILSALLSLQAINHASIFTYIFGNDDSQVSQCIADPGFACTVQGSDIMVTRKDIKVTHGSIAVKFSGQVVSVPIHSETAISAVRLYPSVVSVVKGQITKTRIVGKSVGLSVRPPDSRVSAVYSQDSGVIKLHSNEALETDLVVYVGSKEVCRGHIFVD